MSDVSVSNYVASLETATFREVRVVRKRRKAAGIRNKLGCAMFRITVPGIVPAVERRPNPIGILNRYKTFQSRAMCRAVCLGLLSMAAPGHTVGRSVPPTYHHRTLFLPTSGSPALKWGTTAAPLSNYIGSGNHGI